MLTKSACVGVLLLSIFGSARVNATALIGRHSVGAFHTSNDNLEHAIIAKTDRTVHELYWAYGSSTFSDATLWTYSTSILAISGWYTPGDNNRHVAVALSNNTVREIYYGGSCSGVCEGPIPGGSFSSTITDVSGWQSNDGYSHISVVTVGGYIYDYNFHTASWNVVAGSYSPYYAADVSGYSNTGTGNRLLSSVYGGTMNDTEYSLGSFDFTGFVTTNSGNCSLTEAAGVGAYAYSSGGALVWGSSPYLCWGIFTDPTSNAAYSYFSGNTIWNFGRSILSVEGYYASTYHNIVAMAAGDVYDIFWNGSAWTFKSLGTY